MSATHPPLLIEIGCEEIPARMIRGACAELSRRVERLLDQAGLEHGELRAWGGSRRLAVRVEQTAGRQADRQENVTGPLATAAFDADGRPTGAAQGFARKHGIAPEDLAVVETAKGARVGFSRVVHGLGVGALLARDLPGLVEGMSFPKTMRWGDGSPQWVRPVHWILALHGTELLPVELFGVRAAAHSVGHRFLGAAEVPIDHADAYASALEAAYVIIDPEIRRQRLDEALRVGAARLGGTVLEDPLLLDEVAELVEWPGVVEGRIDPDFLTLPRELLITTLRHHQKCFAVQKRSGRLLPAFLAVANTEHDPKGHIRRGNEWVVSGRLDDARFFWNEDRKRRLGGRFEELTRVVYHAKLGSYADKAQRMEKIAAALGKALDLDATTIEHAAAAALSSKNDLVTGTVGEFPELQGVAGGLLMAADGEPQAVWQAVYAHYRPLGPDDALPETEAGCLVSVADKLDSVARFILAGEAPTGSRDPFGLRRACSGIFRIVSERRWPLSLEQLARLGGEGQAVLEFLADRFRNFLRDQGATANEIMAVMRPRIDDVAALRFSLHDVAARIAALRAVRAREDFAHLADLTKRIDNILTKGSEEFESALEQGGDRGDFEEDKPAALKLWSMVDEFSGKVVEHEERMEYAEVVDLLARFIDPVEQFFAEVLVLDPDNPGATLQRRQLLERLKTVLTQCFDIRELAGQAERRT